MEECPICLSSRSNMIRLTCQHKFCLSCGHKWIAQHFSCPLCRRQSLYFSKNTRSLTVAQDLAFVVRVILDVFDYKLSNGDYINMLDLVVLDDKYKHIWYRPDMKPILSILVQPLNELENNHLSKTQQKIIKRLVNMVDKV